MIACKDSLLKLGYAGEISLSNSSLLAAHEGRHISPFPFKVVFFFFFNHYGLIHTGMNF